MKQQLKDLLKDIWNVPNVLTMIRLVLIPVFAAVYLAGHTHLALLIFCIASVTDCLDGFIARKYHLITAFGRLMDPLADKLMVCTALVCQAVRGIVPWGIIAIVGAKELLLIVGSLYMLKKNIVVSANFVGKIGTCAFIAALVLGFLRDDFIRLGWHPIDQMLMLASVGMAVCALLNYIVEGLSKLKAQNDQG